MGSFTLFTVQITSSKNITCLGKLVAGVDHLGLEAVVLHEKVKQLLRVPRLLDLASDFGVLEDLEDWLSLPLQLFEVLNHLQPLLGERCRDVHVRVEALVHVYRKVDHAGVGEQVDLSAQQFGLIVESLN